MEDVQSQFDGRGVHVDSAGIRDVRYPITVHNRTDEPQRTVATATVAVGVPHHVRGTHMSRLIAALDDHADQIDAIGVCSLLQTVCRRLGADSALVELAFAYSIRRAAPVTGCSAYATYDAWYKGTERSRHRTISIGVRVPVTTLCPCSKAISDYGAHNQRADVTIEVVLSDPTQHLGPTFRELIDVAESSASAPVYPVIKRPDERFVTMQAYDKPVFVEDVVRDCALPLRTMTGVAQFRVDATTHESIHSHNAFARVGWTPAANVTNGKARGGLRDLKVGFEVRAT